MSVLRSLAPVQSSPNVQRWAGPALGALTEDRSTRDLCDRLPMASGRRGRRRLVEGESALDAILEQTESLWGPQLSRQLAKGASKGVGKKCQGYCTTVIKDDTLCGQPRELDDGHTCPPTCAIADTSKFPLPVVRKRRQRERVHSWIYFPEWHSAMTVLRDP